MSDLYLRILRMLAKHRQGELDDHDAAEHTGDAAAPRRRRELKRAAAQTKARMARRPKRDGATPGPLPAGDATSVR